VPTGQKTTPFFEGNENFSAIGGPSVGGGCPCPESNPLPQWGIQRCVWGIVKISSCKPIAAVRHRLDLSRDLEPQTRNTDPYGTGRRAAAQCDLAVGISEASID